MISAPLHAAVSSVWPLLHDLLLFLAGALVLFCLIAIPLIIVNSRRLVENESGYLFYSMLGFQHRFYAERYLGRKLLRHEEVHHINGRTRDNHPRNLCIIERDAHRAFHDWLRQERQRLGRYPAIAVQKDMLTNRFNGLLLEDHFNAKRR